MGTHARERGNGAGSDAERGRTASAAGLRDRLPVASAAFLEGALANPALGEDEIILLLRNRRADPIVLTRIARSPRWFRVYEVKKGLARHPRVPLGLARGLLAHLYWRDLSEVTEDARVHPAVRHQAEEVLRIRLQEMTLGERIALARKASRGIVMALRDSDDPKVLAALLGNPRLIEPDVLTIAGNALARREVLRELAEHPSWGIRRAVRLTLLRNPRTPVQVALRLLRSLPREDLEGLKRDPSTPKIVRLVAGRQMEEEDDFDG